MPGDTKHLQAYLIVDNCFLAMLSDCFCDRFAAQYAQNQLIPQVEQWIDGIINTVKQFAVDGNLYSTRCVVEEYYPHASRLANRPGVQKTHLDHVQIHVRNHLHQSTVDAQCVKNLRQLNAAPKSLVGSSGLSDNDLSLVQLGLEMTHLGSPVYILSNDQGLLDFVSWIRTQRRQFNVPIDPGLLQAWRCLTYLEQIHRSCNITTDLMQALIEYSLSDHYSREELAGTVKGKSIFSQLLDVNRSFSQSIAIKIQPKVVTNE